MRSRLAIFFWLTWPSLSVGCSLGLSGEGELAPDGSNEGVLPGNLITGSAYDAGGSASTGSFISGWMEAGGGPQGADGAPAPAGNVDGSAPSGPPPPANVDAGGCDFESGTWGSRIAIDVSWVPQGLVGIILAPGSGRILQWTKSTRTARGGATTDSTVVCGIELPDFSGTQLAGSESYGVRFPDPLFDNGYLKSFTVSGTIAGSAHGATYRSEPAAALLGLTLSDPTNAPWPTPVTTAVDSDQDGRPGVTVSIATGGGYSYAPVDGLKTARADRLFLVIRQVTVISATAMDCDHFVGTVTIPMLGGMGDGGGKFAIDSHIVGCTLVNDGGTCDSTQTNFVDATQPVFSPSGLSQFTSVRLPDSADCAAVRAAMP